MFVNLCDTPQEVWESMVIWGWRWKVATGKRWCTPVTAQTARDQTRRANTKHMEKTAAGTGKHSQTLRKLYCMGRNLVETVISVRVRKQNQQTELCTIAPNEITHSQSKSLTRRPSVGAFLPFSSPHLLSDPPLWGAAVSTPVYLALPHISSSCRLKLQ